jgi:hypothetical protein
MKIGEFLKINGKEWTVFGENSQGVETEDLKGLIAVLSGSDFAKSVELRDFLVRAGNDRVEIIERKTSSNQLDGYLFFTSPAAGDNGNKIRLNESMNLYKTNGARIISYNSGLAGFRWEGLAETKEMQKGVAA